MTKQGSLKIKDHQIHKYIKLTDESNIKFAIDVLVDIILRDLQIYMVTQ